jgi:hypothetical protein
VIDHPRGHYLQTGYISTRGRILPRSSSTSS